MKHLSLALFLVNGLSLMPSTEAVAQSSDSIIHRPNVIKLNLTSHYLYTNSYLVTYERVLKKNESLGIMFGYVEFPIILEGYNHFQSARASHSGFITGGEYRFYLQQENRHPTPRGVYLGPYVSYYSFQNNYNITSDYTGVSTQGTLKSDISFLNIGFQLGYQFVFNNRWAMDFVFFGPSVSNYRMNIKLDENFTVDESNEIIQSITETVPLLSKLLKDETISANGKTSVWTGGYRFCFQVGYKFGRKNHRGSTQI